MNIKQMFTNHDKQATKKIQNAGDKSNATWNDSLCFTLLQRWILKQLKELLENTRSTKETLERKCILFKTRSWNSYLIYTSSNQGLNSAKSIISHGLRGLSMQQHNSDICHSNEKKCQLEALMHVTMQLWISQTSFVQ